MTVSADQLREVMVQVADLENRVNHIVDRPIPAKFPVNFDASVSALFVAPDASPQTPTWVNGGPDFWCTGVGYQVLWTVTPSEGTGGTLKLRDWGNGLGWTTAEGVAFDPQLFDFRWGMTKMSNARGTLFTYLTAPGSVDSLLTKQALGNQETGRVLRFSPWKIERGDSVIFTIKPVGYYWSKDGVFAETSGVASRFTVMMTMYGFRDQTQRATP